MHPDAEMVRAETGAGNVARPVDPEPAKKIQNEMNSERAAAPVAERRKTELREREPDRAELHFSLNREEREIFAAAFAPGGGTSSLSEDEQDVLRQAAERISKGIDEVIAKNAENRKWVEKAVTEWYASMVRTDDVRNDDSGQPDLIRLLRAAAMGNLGDFPQ